MRKTYTPNDIRALAKQSGPQWESEVRAALVFAADLLDAADAAVKSTQPNNEVYGWIIDGSSYLLRGEFAEIDAKSEAKRCGGTCKAYPVYIKPQQVSELTDAAQDLVDVLDAYHDQLVPINRKSVTCNNLRAVLAVQKAKR